MNTQHRDILTTIGRKQPITTSGVAEYLMDHFGYGGGMEFDVFRDQVSKTIGYLKSKGDITGEDRPQPKGKPLRFWSIAESKTEEMASDVAGLEQPQPVVNESLTVEAAAEESSATDEAERRLRESAFQEQLKTGALYDVYAKEMELKRHTAVAIEAYEDGKAAVKLTHMSISQAMDAYHLEVAEDTDINFYTFCLGISFAEKHHGISHD